MPYLVGIVTKGLIYNIDPIIYELQYTDVETSTMHLIIIFYFRWLPMCKKSVRSPR